MLVCLPRLHSLDLSGTCDVLAVCRELRDIHWLVRSSGGMLPLDGRGLGGTVRAQGMRGRDRGGTGRAGSMRVRDGGGTGGH